MKKANLVRMLNTRARQASTCLPPQICTKGQIRNKTKFFDPNSTVGAKIEAMLREK